VRRELPYAYEGDERTMVQIAVRMATSLDLNPRWFGNPGSTVLYPLTFLYRASDVLVHGAPLLGPDRPLLERFRADPGFFYLAGRVMNVGYAVASLGLLFLVGRKAWGERVALAGVLLAALCPLPMAHAQLARTDAAALFFEMLALFLCLRLLEVPSRGRHLAAGAAIGLAVASRYFLAALLLPFLASSLLRGGARRALLGLAATAAAFLAVTPFFMLELGTVLSGLTGEARSSHAGEAPLGPFGNFVFYTLTVLPAQLGTAGTLLAAAGLALAVARSAAAPRVLALFVAGLIAGVCSIPLHWPRWIIPALPLLALFAAAALDQLVTAALGRLGRLALSTPVLVASLALVAWPAAGRFAREALRASRPTTRLQARAFLLERLPGAARLVAERGSAALVPRQQALEDRLDLEPRGVLERSALGGKSLEVLLVASLAKRGPLEEYRREGWDYAVTARYEGVPISGEQAAFDGQLVAGAEELARFDPEPLRAGPRIRVWRLR
jgi:hypothetical protein